MKRLLQFLLLFSLLIIIAISCYQKQPVSPEAQALAFALLSQDSPPDFLFGIRIRNNGPDPMDVRLCLFKNCSAEGGAPVYDFGNIPPGNTSAAMETETFGYFCEINNVIVNDNGPLVPAYDDVLDFFVTPILCEIEAGPDYETTCERE